MDRLIQSDMIENGDNRGIQRFDFGSERLGRFGPFGDRDQVTQAAAAKIPGDDRLAAQRLLVEIFDSQ